MARWRRRFHFDSTALLCGAVLIVSFAAARLPQWLPPSCPSERWFGIRCPGCGLTRAFLALARGDIVAAWGFHPWALLLFPMAVGYAIRPLVRGMLPPKPPATTERPWVPPTQRWVAVIGLLGFAAWAVLRAVREL